MGINPMFEWPWTRRIRELVQKKAELTVALETLVVEKQALTTKYHLRGTTINTLKSRNSTLRAQYGLDHITIRHLTKSVDMLQRMLDSAMNVPAFELKWYEYVTIEAYNVDLLQPYHVLAADLRYHAPDKDAWDATLPAIQAEVKQAIRYWRPEISDCDDWALAMVYGVMMAAIKGKLTRQVAFMVLWSGNYTHAYNGYIDSDDIVWVYEPQNGKTIGKIEEMTDEAYDTTRVWFPH